jgi:hypothetical protein
MKRGTDQRINERPSRGHSEGFRGRGNPRGNFNNSFRNGGQGQTEDYPRNQGGQGRGNLYKRPPTRGRDSSVSGHEAGTGENKYAERDARKNFKKKKEKPEGVNNQNLSGLAQIILNKESSVEEKEKSIEKALLLLDEYGLENVGGQ